MFWYPPATTDPSTLPFGFCAVWRLDAVTEQLGSDILFKSSLAITGHCVLGKHGVPHRNICLSLWPKANNNNNNSKCQTIWQNLHFLGNGNWTSRKKWTVIKPHCTAYHNYYYSCSFLIFSGLNKILKSLFTVGDLLLREMCAVQFV